jgi:hypothetical protein
VPVAQVAQAVEPHARRKAPVELGFGGGIGRGPGRGDAAGERTVIERGERGILRHGSSITSLLRDV